MVAAHGMCLLPSFLERYRGYSLPTVPVQLRWRLPVNEANSATQVRLGRFAAIC